MSKYAHVVSSIPDQHRRLVMGKNEKCDFSLAHHFSGVLNPIREQIRAFSDLPTFSFNFQSTYKTARGIKANERVGERASE